MTIAEYQPLAMRTSPEGHDRILNGCMGLIGEAGEVVDAVKKWKFQSGDHAELPKEKLIDECGDVLWYCAELATGLSAELDDLYEAFSDDFFEDLHPYNVLSPIEWTVAFMAMAAARPFGKMYDAQPGIPAECKAAQTKAEIVGIMVMVSDILALYCDCDLSGCMEKNIEKLRCRYPDGFDPERSLHREV